MKTHSVVKKITFVTQASWGEGEISVFPKHILYLFSSLGVSLHLQVREQGLQQQKKNEVLTNANYLR